MIRLPVKKADARCSCVTEQYECGFCRGPKLRRIWNSMTERQRDYDRYVAHAPREDADYDGERSCSCHLSAPCSWCMDQPDPDAAEATTASAVGMEPEGRNETKPLSLTNGGGGSLSPAPPSSVPVGDASATAADPREGS